MRVNSQIPPLLYNYLIVPPRVTLVPGAQPEHGVKVCCSTRVFAAAAESGVKGHNQHLLPAEISPSFLYPGSWLQPNLWCSPQLGKIWVCLSSVDFGNSFSQSPTYLKLLLLLGYGRNSFTVSYCVFVYIFQSGCCSQWL